MNQSAILALIHNLALLLAMAFIFDITLRQWNAREKKSAMSQILLGALLGGIAIALILTPWEVFSGILFDARYILFGLSGLFFGWRPTLVAGLVASLYRYQLGGLGVASGIAGMTLAGTIGVVWRHFRSGNLAEMGWLELYAFGFLVHLSMPLFTVFLPRELAIHVLTKVFPLVLVIHPVATAMLGVLLVNRIRHDTRMEKVKEDEAKFHIVADNTYDWEYWLAEDGRFIYCSPSCERVCGYTREEFMEKPWLLGRIVYPDDVPLLKQCGCDRVRDNHCEVECRLLLPDDSIRWISHVHTPIHDEEGKFLGIRCSNRDITDRKNAEETIKREQNFTEAVLNSVPGLLYLYDDQGRLIRWNKKHEEITGYNPEELSQMHLMDWYANDKVSSKKISDAIERVKIAGWGEEEAEMQLKSGKKVPFFFTAVLLEIEGRKYFTGIGIDITARKKAEEDLRKSRRFLADLIEHSGDADFCQGPCGTL